MQPEQDKKPVEVKDIETPKNNQETQPPQETQEQINWKKFREAREIERKEKEAANKRAAEKEAEAAALKAAMEALLNKPQHHQNHNVENEEDETEDQRIQKKVDAALTIRERQIEEQRRQREQMEFPQKLIQTFSDFNQVCSTENLDYLEYHYPEVASAFKHVPDGFEKWASVYKAVKRFVPNTESRKEQVKAEKNFTKPQSMNVPGVTQTGDSAPQILDDQRRAANWARMQRVMKGG